MRGFGGVARRFQFRGEIDGVTLVDDYAHIPGEISAMIGAAREGGWGRVIVVFQPHRYTRTARLWRDFAGPRGNLNHPGIAHRVSRCELRCQARAAG